MIKLYKSVSRQPAINQQADCKEMNTGQIVLISDRSVLVFLFMGIFILLFCIVMSDSLVHKGVLLNGDYGMSKAVVTAKKQAKLNSDPKLTPGDIKKLADTTGTRAFSYSAHPGQYKTTAKAAGANAFSNITGTNHIFPCFFKIDLMYGSFFTEAAENEGAYVAVIDDRLAWYLFKTGNAVGRTFEIFDKPFKIVGVIEWDDSVLSRLIDNGCPHIFIPGARLLELDKTAAIHTFQIGTAGSGTMDNNKAKISEALLESGMNPDDYRITDFNIKKAQLEQKPAMLVFAMGGIVILIILFRLLASIRETVSFFHMECKADYLADAVKRNGTRIGFAVIKVISGLTAIFFVADGIRFKFFIPPERIPEELIDVSFYIELIKTGIRSSIDDLGYIPEDTELLIDRLDLMTGWILFFTAAVGFLFIYAAFTRLMLHKADIHRLSLACGLFVLLSVVILATVANISGLPFSLDIESILVMWAFVYVNILYFSILKGKDSV